MDPLSGEYSAHHARTRGLRRRQRRPLGDELDRLGASRGGGRHRPHARRVAAPRRVTGALGARCVHVFTGPPARAGAAVAELRGRSSRPRRLRGELRRRQPDRRGQGAVHRAGRRRAVAALPHVAVPTTLSAGEFTAVAASPTTARA
jgi:hypothetical protein